MSKTNNLTWQGARETFWRTLLAFSASRLVIAGVLVIYLIFNAKRGVGDDANTLYWQTTFIYFLISFGVLILAARFQRYFLSQLVLQIAVDIFVISVLYISAGGAKSGLAILYLFPLAGGAVLAPFLLALLFVSATTLILLGEATYQMLSFAIDSSFSQAGLYGAAYFFAVFVIHRLAASLIQQERLAAQRGIDLQVQQAINRLVIEDMGDGMLVVGPSGELLMANPAAERMLGIAVSHDRKALRLDTMPTLKPIEEAFIAWRQCDRDVEEAAFAFVVVKPGDDAEALFGSTILGTRHELGSHLKLHFVQVEAAGLTEDRAVIFLQDVTEIENQAQQLKLASMGRLTASIAHEVRNPLSAIGHASSLLAEEASDPGEVRLLKIVSDNVARLDRMIEDILKLSRKAQTHDEPLALAPFFADVLAEFNETHTLAESMIEVENMAQYHVWFDPMHLREVVVNLLTNALRYSSGLPASIQIFPVLDSINRLEIHVRDDGPPVTPEVRAHLFEPFYTTSSKGTGLGLYLARELCLNNGAMIDYEYRFDVREGKTGHGRSSQTSGRFVITFAMAD